MTTTAITTAARRIARTLTAAHAEGASTAEYYADRDAEYGTKGNEWLDFELASSPALDAFTEGLLTGEKFRRDPAGSRRLQLHFADEETAFEAIAQGLINLGIDWQDALTTRRH